MTRSEFDDIRAHIAAEEGDSDDLLQIARSLLDDLEQARLREVTLRAHYSGLLTAARAAVASDAVGDPDPLAFLRHELSKKGRLAHNDDQAAQILSDTHLAESMLAHLEEATSPSRPQPRTPIRRCSGMSRRLHH